jgi:CheY-like chemotaxis protein
MATILFVDDDEMERTFAREILEPRGHRVLYAGDGESALRVFATEPVDVVVTDLAMPRLNGLRLIKRIRAEHPRVHVIAASGKNADQLDLAEDFGALAVLKKPWDPQRFLDTLERILTADETTAADMERVWPTIQSGTQFDEEGRMIRSADGTPIGGPAERDEPDVGSVDEGGPAEAYPWEEMPDVVDTGAKRGKSAKADFEAVDLGLEGMELEVEDPEDFGFEDDPEDPEEG